MKYILSLILLLASVCFSFGQKKSDLGDFTSIKASGEFELRLVHAKEASIEIKSENVELSMLSFEVKDSQLKIKPLLGFPKDGKVVVELSYVRVNSFVAGKGIKVYTRDTLATETLFVKSMAGSEVDFVLNCDTVVAKVNKGGFMRLVGNAGHVKLNTSTGGDYRAAELYAKTMSAKLAGGSAEVNVEQFIDVKATMKGRFYYEKQPTKIKKKASLGGRIGKLDEF